MLWNKVEKKERKDTGEKTSEFVVELSKIEEKYKITENSYGLFQINLVLNFQRFLLRLANFIVFCKNSF